MEYLQLGKSGLRVSRICVGCMSYGAAEADSWILQEEKALPLLDYCYKKGFNFFDTANVYSSGTSEEILGRAIKKYEWRRGEHRHRDKGLLPSRSRLGEPCGYGYG